MYIFLKNSEKEMQFWDIHRKDKTYLKKSIIFNIKYLLIKIWKFIKKIFQINIE